MQIFSRKKLWESGCLLFQIITIKPYLLVGFNRKLVVDIPDSDTNSIKQNQIISVELILE